ncbi:Cys-tRNA(Pro) deacylase [Novosphingobium sp. FSY-8]|uniref:Cys-tRNA(Pro)/Cys-tRNA(Cys) deacylase n=1 Tax=Novosphingobium ovatum TaxID=1908523 RepID=A0ABW9XH56_9SPHN|nr:Cys-tRNA(Pro) deacylase [Novosphingobium ovatum]NBC37893.1 Cys-tRNA(Pro) deacylase [Novosphingobium ovatum]
MSRVTRATRMLDEAGIAYATIAYDYDPDADRIGMAAAQALGEDPACVLKTLMVLADGKPACVILPSDQTVSMKKLAAALRAKSAQMMPPADAERMTGYKVGGISPFGQMRRVPTVLEEMALVCDHVYVNGGQRGLQLRLLPDDVLRAIGAVAADITA